MPSARKHLRHGDFAARLGGDEFAIVQSGSHHDLADIAASAGRLVDILSAPYQVDDQQAVVGASVGISIAPADGTEPDQLLRNADMALYRAKAEG